jgi:phosphopantetheinyl transferase (holo-ACP synthase)
MSEDRQESVVQALRLAPGGCRVIYASVPESSTAGEIRQAENRCGLAALLCEHLRAQETALWKNHPFYDRAARPLRIAHDALGCPRLLRGEHAGPSISFSKAGERVWAALSGDESAVGIDVAGSAEFRKGYPARRAFHAQELEQAVSVTGGDVASALALLWSVKEAVVKALGCAFHLADPLDLHVRTADVEQGGRAFSASLSGKALLRFPVEGRQPMAVRSVPLPGAWLTIAAVRLPQGRHGG